MVLRPTQMQNFGEILRATAQRLPEKLAVVCNEKRYNYSRLEEESNRVASALQQAGIGPGDKVAILTPNCVEFLCVVFGCAKLGAVAVKLNWRLAPEELKYLIDFNDVKAMFYRYRNVQWHAQLYKLLHEKGTPNILFVSLDESDSIYCYRDFIAGGSPQFPLLFQNSEQTLMHLHTSGASGRPKTVVYTHRSFLNQIDACIDGLNFYEDMVFLSMSQMFHSASSGIYTCIAVGATAVIFSHFDPQSYLQAVSKEHVTRLSAIPTVLQSLLHQPNLQEYDLSAVRTIGYSAAPMSPALIEEAIAKLNCEFMQSYGMTEMSSIVTILKPEDHLKNNYRHLYTVGTPIRGVQIRIVDEEGRDCPTGVTGQIVIKGPGMMKEYYKQPEKTASVLKDGWYYSDDLGYLDEEGFLTLNGRKSDLIITGGENVFSREIENVLADWHSVKESCVFGSPDEYWGEMVSACVVPEDGCSLSEKEIYDFCHTRIAGYKVPKKIFIVDQLPHNAVGKINKPEVIRIYANKRAGDKA